MTLQQVVPCAVWPCLKIVNLTNVLPWPALAASVSGGAYAKLNSVLADSQRVCLMLDYTASDVVCQVWVGQNWRLELPFRIICTLHLPQILKNNYCFLLCRLIRFRRMVFKIQPVSKIDSY